MSEKIITVFDSADEALAAVRKLRRAGFADSAITLMSSEPIHDDDAGEGKPSRTGWFAIAGGAAGATAAVALTVMTSRQVNIVTGGMPIVSPWAFGIIVFELGALGAILFTLFRMIWEARLLRPLADYDEAVADGRAVLAVECADQISRGSAQKILS